MVKNEHTERLNQVLDLSWNIFKSQFISGRHEINKEAPFQHHFADIINKVGNLFCLTREDAFYTDLETKFPNLKHENKNKYIDITCEFYKKSKCAIELKFKKESQGAQDHGRIDIFQDLEAVELACKDVFDIGKLFVITDSKPYINQSVRGVGTIFPTHNGYKTIPNVPYISTSKGREDITITFRNEYEFVWEEIQGFHFLSITVLKNNSNEVITEKQQETISSENFYEWNGYCPESFLNGEKVRMRLNQNDFYESEKTGLQIAMMFPGVQAVIMNKRGNGKFRQTENYADEKFNFEILSEQTTDNPPFCDTELIQNTKKLKEIITKIK